jgi:hypothetical protein
VVFVRKRLPEIQYLKAKISPAQQQQFAALVQHTISQIEGANFYPHSGIRFPQNQCLSCSFFGLCLKNQQLIEAKLKRRTGIDDGWLTSLITKEPPMAPELNRRRAQFVLGKIDEILAWERRVHSERDTHFVELGRYLCEVRSGQYWRLENLASFDDFLERRFPESRRKAYYLMAIHDNLPKEIRRELKAVGWSKATELAKLARRQGEQFESAKWLHVAKQLPFDPFKQEIERALNGPNAEPWDMIYFKLHKSAIPEVEQALETAARMLGSDKSRGYCLEMICADFLAGANLENGNPEVLLCSLLRFFCFLPANHQRRFLEQLRVAA